MSRVESGSGRATIEHVGNEMRISIPSKRQLALLLLFPTGMATMVLIFSTGPYRQLFSDSPFGRIFLSVCVLFAMKGLFEWLWTIAGKEIISATPERLCIEKKLLGLGIRRHYDSKLIENCHVIPDAPTSSLAFGGRYAPPYNGGTIGFAYGNKTKRFGIFLEEAEARYIIDELREHRYIKGETAKQ